MKLISQAWDQILLHIQEDRALTTFEVSKICGVVHSTVSYWIDERKLIAYKTPGGHRRVKKINLLLFLKTYDIPVPSELMSLMEGQTPGAATHIPPEAAKTNGLGRKRILIASSNAAVCESARDALRAVKPRPQIISALNEFEAGKQIVILSPNLVILDLSLKKAEVFEALENIRRDRKCAMTGTRVLALTDHEDPATLEKIKISGGAEGILSNPFTVDRIRNAALPLLFETGARA